ncbi:aromatase/cyclase [Micromonospora sp. NPDC004540]|uniref:aromatase/cyclase n=1 Tax=Micromonospora sp. NPDC004540 TaxID=3154457 RepID=UPI0033A7D4C5
MPHRTEHTLTVAAPARVLYDLAADVTRWPAIFAPTVHVRHLDRSGSGERFQLWALVGDEVKTWTSRRGLDAAGLRISFRQERSQPPIASMSGEWIFRELAPDRTEITLVHEFTAVDDDPEQVRWIRAALDGNSPVELAALARIATTGHPVEDVVFTFTDRVTLDGAAADAYDFVDRCDLWPRRLPHVDRVVLRDIGPGLQDLEMDTVTEDGATHTTRSVRVCTPPGRIVYKQRVPPRLLLGHSGRWLFADTEQGAVVTAEHTVAIDPARVGEVLGEGATLADARDFIRSALGRNSRTTLAHAGSYAAARR